MLHYCTDILLRDTRFAKIDRLSFEKQLYFNILTSQSRGIDVMVSYIENIWKSAVITVIIITQYIESYEKFFMDNAAIYLVNNHGIMLM